jgi:hypothetical protein
LRAIVIFWPGRLALTAAAGIAPRLTFQVGGLDVQEVRAPFDAGLRVRIARSRAADLAADVGVGGAIFRATGTNTSLSQSGTRLDLGARAGVVVHFRSAAARLRPLLGLHAEVFPKPYDITVTPQGTLGHTPALWFGATAGLAVTP